MQNYNPEIIENEIIEFWQKNKIYEKAKAKNNGAKKFYYLDGPPYTSGRIHIGHAWGKSLRDSIMRYLRMKGLDVWDRPGFDMHGLPTSHKVEAKLGLKSKDEIGVKVSKEEFVKECEKFAMENMDLMITDFKRLGIWMNWDDPYIPIKSSFIEGNWWLIKKAHENGYLYEGKKVMSWCPSCATSLAKHELDYETVTEKSIFVKFKVLVDEKGKNKEKENEYLIIWTTTPWTIPFNMAVMVNPELDYVRCKVPARKELEKQKYGKKEQDEVWILAAGLAAPVIQAVADREMTVIEEFKGEELEGLRYRQPFFEEIKFHQEEEERSKNAKEGEQSKRSYTVLLSKEYVTLSAGSGLVHCAPGCGPEDYEVGHKYKVPAFNEIDEKGEFPKSMGKFAGLVAKKDDKKFVEALNLKCLLVAETPVEHEYAHCWRCKSPVVFKTTTQWFFDVETELKDKMIEANKSIKWVPDWAGNKWFDSWLRNLRDNGITRQIIWGPPLPIWRCTDKKCNHYDVIGSIDELEKNTAKKRLKIFTSPGLMKLLGNAANATVK
ncbi:MAG: class I tRNA ligase family protein [Nanoarchaeota archaeon]|nr:class I tRNA ligase family protein [Nanoarchaeota archaeon]